MRAPAPAKINLALVVGPRRDDGKHELVTVYQRIGIVDRVEVEQAEQTRVDGFAGDTIVRDALLRLSAHAGVDVHWRARLEKEIPVAAGLGGGSSDAATALRLANEQLDEPVPADELHDLAAGLGADVPFFLRDGPQLGTGDGTTLATVDIPQDFWVVLALPNDARKESTASVYAQFDERNGATGFQERRDALVGTLDGITRARELAALPLNDLARSPLADELTRHGAFRADVSGAGPAVYALFHHRHAARAAQRAVRRSARTWLTAPAWYG